MKRGSGILLHISSLPSRGGIGDCGPQAYAFVDMLQRCGQSYWQVLPMNPTDWGNFYSPYLSPCAFALNPLFISLDILVRDVLLDEHDLEDVDNQVQGPVDFAHVEQIKLPLIKKSYQVFKRTHRQRKAFEAFCEQQAGWLDDYALFSVLKRMHGGKPWFEWPKSFRVRDTEALAQFSRDNAEAVECEKFIQYIAANQWQALKAYCASHQVRIVGDVPIYVAYDSCDVWANHSIFKLDDSLHPTVVSGVPPDYFSATGQLWNTPVYDWQILAASKFAWWMHRLEVQLARCDVVRIDHFRGLVQYWEVAAGETTAINGRWCDVPTSLFFNTVLERFTDSVTRIIAEDLGIITDDVRAVMQHYGFPGMKILQFAFSDGNPDHIYRPHTYPTNCIAYPGTHDNNTLLGWIEHDATAQERQAMQEYLQVEDDPHLLLKAACMALSTCAADVVIFPLQDILGLGAEARMNVPGRPADNWRWRFAPHQLTVEAEKFLTQLTRAGKR